MPVPLIIAGLVGLAGAKAHMSAKEKNERAQEIAQSAKSLYNDAKQSLERAQAKTENSLLKLGYAKKEVMDTSVAQFLKAYERIKKIEFKQSVGIDEIANLSIDHQAALKLRELSDIYQSTFSSGATGAATGAVVALAASGSLSVVTGGLSVAGSALALGQFGAAAGIAGSALSFGATMTPLSAIAAPVLLFTGISSSMKAEENLEKANAMYAEAELAVEKMKTSETLCYAIAKKANMFDQLLGELNAMFSKCAAMMDSTTEKKQGVFRKKTITENDFTDEDFNLFAVTRSLAGAIKAIIDTPIIGNDGGISEDSVNVYNNTKEALPLLSNSYKKLEQARYVAKDVGKTTQKKSVSKSEKKSFNKNTKNGLFLVLEVIRDIFAIFVGFFSAMVAQVMIADTILCGVLGFTITTLALMDNNSSFRFFAGVNKILCISLFVSSVLLFYHTCSYIFMTEHYILKSVIVGFITFFVYGLREPENGRKLNTLTITLCRVCGCVGFASVGILLYIFVAGYLDLNYSVIKILITLFYSVLAYFPSCKIED